MLEKIRKHSVKMVVFSVNLILAAVAVFVFRENDQARLLDKAQEEKEKPESEQVSREVLQSFEGSVESEDQEKKVDIPDAVITEPDEPVAATTPDPPLDIAPQVIVPEISPKEGVPAPVSDPVPPKKTKPADTKTKTS